MSVLISTLGDDEDEPDEYFLARLSNPVGAPIGVVETQVWILDTNLPCLSVGNLEVNVGLKGQAVAFVPVWLSSASRTNITVDFATRNGTAIGGPDFEHRSGTVTFLAGTTNQEVRLVISGNTRDEGPEHFFVDLSNPRGATFCRSTGVVTITDIEPAGLTVDNVEVPEGQPGQTNYARFILRLDRPLPNPASVEVSTADGTARAGLDYQPLSPTTFTFTPGQTNLTVTVPIVGDLKSEPAETFFLLLTKPQNLVLTIDRATATIRDDDCAPAPCGIVAWWSGEGDLDDRITGLPTEKRGPGQVTFPPARVGAGLRFDGAANLETADSPSFALTNLTLEAWIRCDGIGAENRVILLKGASRLNDTTSYVLVIHGQARDSISAQGKIWGVDVPGTLSLLLSDGVHDHIFHSRTVVSLGQWMHIAATVGPDTVSLYLDGTLDAAYPLEIVPLANHSPVQIGGITTEGNRFSFVGIIDELSLYHRALSADELRAIYDAGAAGKCLEAPTDPALSVLEPEPIAENTPGGVVRLTVRLSEPPCRPVRVRYSTEDQTALAGSDYVAANDWLSFEPGQTEQEIVLTILDDDVSESHTETFKLLLAEPLNAVLANASTAVTILDNDTNIIAFPPSLSPIPDQVIHEDTAGSVSFTVDDPDTPLEQLILTASSWHPALIPQSELKLAGSGTNRILSFRPAPNQFGIGPFGDAWIFVIVSDGSQSAWRTFKVTVLPVNDPPSFAPGPEVSVNEDAGAITLPGWATQISPGPANEREQELSFTLTPADPGLFSQTPALDPSGTLRFSPAPNAFGTNSVTIVLRDTGGTERGGLDTFTHRFNLAIQAVNDPPTLDPIADRSHRANSAVQTVPLTGITTGAPNEIQSLTVSAISDNPALLEPTVQYTSPAATGTLTYQPKPGQSGTATITVTVRDSGGVERGGQDQVQRSFRVTVLPNQPPTVRLSAPTDGQVFPAPATVPLQAIATDPDGQVVQVEFLANGRVIGQDTTDPFQLTWTAVPAGTHDLTARATDNDGAQATSAPVQIVVRVTQDIVLTSPAANATYCPGAPIVFAATVQGELPAGSRVEFHGDDGLFEAATSAPFAVLRRAGLASGLYRVHARLLDGAGQLRARSQTNTFEVLEVCGDVAILKNYDDPQITLMGDLLRAERMFPFVRNGVDVFPKSARERALKRNPRSNGSWATSSSSGPVCPSPGKA
ncbi:MAG: Ig-like domain-containing protein [Verrucomicrobia bacterium]|nr:Ig-like domain-containing protein [Verrucomicrobiota bacterium]